MKIGDKVVCINDSFVNKFFINEPFPKKGEIYELNGIDPLADNPHGQPYYYLKGFDWIVNTRTGIHGRVSFTHKAFRPVDNTFGEIVAETLEQQVEYETALA